MTCPFCGKADNPARAKFCSHCGTALLTSEGVEPDPPAQPAEPIQVTQASDPEATFERPGRSRHGFYAGQVSHLDQLGTAHRPIHGTPAESAKATEPAIQAAGLASPSALATSGHFDERLGSGGRFVSRRPAPPNPEGPPPPAPVSARRPTITPDMVFWFGPKEPAPVEGPAPVEPPLQPSATTAAPEPDPVSRSFGTWANPPVPTTRPEVIVAAERAEAARAAGAADGQSPRPDLSSVRDLFPEPKDDTSGPPWTPAAPVASASRDEQPAQPAGPARPGSPAAEPARNATRETPAPEDTPKVVTPVAAATATGPQTATGGPAGPKGPAGPGNRITGTASDPAAPAPPTKQSRYWATGAHASAFAGAWMGGVPAFVGPLVVWLARKDNDPFAAEHGRNALNFNLSVIVYVLGLVILSIVTFGIGLLVTIPGFIALGVAWFAFTLVGTIKAASSETYSYPLTITFVR